MVGLRLATLWLALIASSPDAPAGSSGDGEVIAPALEVFDEPDEAGYASGVLKPGDRITTVPGGPSGWLAIKPPVGTFDWVDVRSIRILDDGTGEVSEARAFVRSGAPEARMPGPPRPPLPRGTRVRLLDRLPLTLGEGAKARTWRAIEPPVGEIRYVRRDGVRLDPIPTSSPPRSTDPRVELAQGGDGGSVDAVIRRFEDAVRRSRQIDDEVELARRKLTLARTQTERGYDAKGLLQASSHRVDGQKVLALIGPEGLPVAYLAIPPGIPTDRILARKVGVRGDVHYNESLGARLITVRDLDTLDKPR